MLRIVLGALVALLLAGCGSGMVQPTIDVQVANTTNVFYENGPDEKSVTLVYRDWRNWPLVREWRGVECRRSFLSGQTYCIEFVGFDGHRPDTSWSVTRTFERQDGTYWDTLSFDTYSGHHRIRTDVIVGGGWSSGDQRQRSAKQQSHRPRSYEINGQRHYY